MKKLTQTFALLAMVSLLTFTACKKDDTTSNSNITNLNDSLPKYGDDAIIKITPSPSGSTITAGTQLTLTLEFTGNAGNKLKSYKVSSSQSSNFISTGTLSGVSGTAIVKDQPITGTVVYTVILSSDKGDIAQSYTVTVTTANNSYTIDSDNPYLGNQSSSEPKFWSGKRKMRYTLSDAVNNDALQADLDFAYCTRTSGNKLISPSSQDATDIYATQWSISNERIINWSKRNSTTFIKTNISVNSFQNASTTQDIEALISSARSANEPNLFSITIADSEVYLFKTEKGAYGLILAQNPTGTISGGVATDGTVQLTVKYQRAQ